MSFFIGVALGLIVGGTVATIYGKKIAAKAAAVAGIAEAIKQKL